MSELAWEIWQVQGQQTQSNNFIVIGTVLWKEVETREPSDLDIPKHLGRSTHSVDITRLWGTSIFTNI